LNRPRVLLADDNAAVATEIQSLLASAFDVVGVVDSGEALEAAFDRLAPQVIVTDIAMPGAGGLVAVRNILKRHPAAQGVLLTVIDAPLMIQLGLSSGIGGYVIKEDAGEELIAAIHAVLAGRQYLSAAALRSIGEPIIPTGGSRKDK
jgi:two-component system invasion response regulator UvrY